MIEPVRLTIPRIADEPEGAAAPPVLTTPPRPTAPPVPTKPRGPSAPSGPSEPPRPEPPRSAAVASPAVARAQAGGTASPTAHGESLRPAPASSPPGPGERDPAGHASPLPPPAASSGPADARCPAEGEIGGRLPPERIAEMRALVEGSTWSYRRIGAELGVAPATVWRYAVDGQWLRPPGAALPARIARHRDKTTEKLWKLAARHAAALEEQDPEVTRQSLQPLASLTRALGTLSPKPGSGPAPEEEPRPEKPPRSIHELHAELVAHLERIDREEGMYWERFDWNFNHGGGI